jgi:hypothetical protein
LPLRALSDRRGPPAPLTGGLEMAGKVPAGRAPGYGVTTAKVPKGVLMLAPWASPELMSWLKKYSGCPLYVTWKVPSARWMVPSAPLNPVPAGAVLVSTGGQNRAHAPVQLLVPGTVSELRV